ncbi:MAG: hypothetical protein IKN48_11240 [Bacteroidaceae bacterium]|nr:hypothetical protein [Bacteroidaceae bacterium]
MKQTNYYKVAGLTFGIELGEGIQLDGKLGAYEPFRSDSVTEPLFMLAVKSSEGTNAKGDNDWNLILDNDFEGMLTEIYTDAEGMYHYAVRFVRQPDMWSCTDFDPEFKSLTCRVHGSQNFQLFALNNALMLLFALCSAKHDTLLFHSSVIKHDEKGYMFLGKSGTGKSTHSQLWLKYIEGSELLNDDNPAVRLIDGRPWVFGTPWSGKTPCYKNEQVPVGGFLRLWQAPVNEITRLSTLQAYAALLPTVSNMRWEKQCADAVNATLNKVISAVPVFSLKNRPEEAAARMSFNAFKNADGSNG